MDIQWEDPPEDRRIHKKGKYRPTLDALRANPGSWARVAEFDGIQSASATAASIKSGAVLGSAPKGSFEAVSRVLPDDRGGVWARFVGESIRAATP